MLSSLRGLQDIYKTSIFTVVLYIDGVMRSNLEADSTPQRNPEINFTQDDLKDKKEKKYFFKLLLLN